MNFKKLIYWATKIADRYFPDRQLYFRTNGDVRFVTISKNIQIFSSAVLICLVVWFTLASYNYVYVSEILGDKDTEVSKVNSNYEELENQYTELKNDIQKSTTALEQRQKYIQQVLEEEAIIDDSSTSFGDDEIDESAITDDDYAGDGDDLEARNNFRDQSLDKIYVDLKRIEMQQNKTVKAITAKVDSKLSFLQETLDKAGITEKTILSLAKGLPSSAAQGGPYIELKNGINEASLNSTSFDQLYEKQNSLNDLEMAIKYLPVITPPEKYYISSKFGVRRDPVTKKWATHKGVDMAGWHKTPVNAGGEGLVKKAGRNGSFGLYVEIDHGNGFRTKYGHLSKVIVKSGDIISAGQLIGLMGSTGRSVSTHLHYEIWFNGKPIDPLKVFKAAKDVQKIKQQEYTS